MKDLKFIDFRLRPAVGSYRPMFPPQFIENEYRLFRFGSPSAAYAEGSLSKLIDEMDEASISIGVVMGRVNSATCIPNDEVAQFPRDYPSRFAGFAGIDPMSMIQERPLDELERCVKELGLKGICIEQDWLAGTIWSHIGLYPDDGRLYAIYDRCAELGVPIALASGPLAGDDFSYTDPIRIARVARDFPELKIIITHGCYPHVTTILTAAFRHDNIFICPDIYMFMPGTTPYVEAINSEVLGDQMLFGTAYPLAPLKGSVERTLELGLRDDALEKYAFKNAARVLGTLKSNKHDQGV